MRVASARHKATDTLPTVIWQKSNTLTIQIVLDITVRTQPGDADISGISGGTKVEDYKVADSAVEIYTYDKTTYAIWSCEDAGTVMSHSVAVTENETVTDVNALVKALVDDVETNHPRG